MYSDALLAAEVQWKLGLEQVVKNAPAHTFKILVLVDLFLAATRVDRYATAELFPGSALGPEQELGHRIHLILEFAVRKSGDLIQESGQPGSFLRDRDLAGLDDGAYLYGPALLVALGPNRDHIYIRPPERLNNLNAT